MSGPLVFVRDGRTLPFIPVTVAAMEAIRAAVPKRRPFAIATYMALLEFANEDRSDRVAVSQRDLFERAGVSRTTVQTAIADLQAAGVLRVRERIHSNARIENEYVVVEPAERSAIHGTPARDTGDPRPPHGQRTQEERQEEQTTSETTTETSEESGTDLVLLDAPWSRVGERARAEEGKNGALPRFNGRPIPASLLHDAAAALAHYCEQTGQTVTPLDARGQPTESLKRILGAMTRHPEVRTLYRRMIDHTLMAPWWGDDAPHTGVIFGKGAVEQSIQRAHAAPQPGSNMKLTASGQALRALRLAADGGGR